MTTILDFIFALFFSFTAFITALDVPRELPGENDKFADLRVNNKVFIDKSNYIAKLLKQDERFFRICRPRRFGKSNFLQMLNSFLKGNKTLFEGLALHSEQDWQSYPVMYFDFKAMDIRTVEDFKMNLDTTMRKIASSYGIKLSDTESVMTLLDELVFELSEKGQKRESVVILIDEYDWPVRRNADVDNKVGRWEISDFLIEFFRDLKTVSDKIKLLFMTCTIPLELRSFKGGLDFVKDISYDPEYSEMIGLTQEELTTNFKPHINAMISSPNETFDSLVRSLKERYNGYCFSKKTNNPACRLYNFHSVMSSLRNKNISNFWHATSDSEYNMISMYQKEEYRRHVGTLKSFTNYTISRSALQSRIDFNIPMSMVVFMVVYGYLTFRSYNEITDEFNLDFPNVEVREKFIKEVLEPVPAGKLPTNDILDKCEKLRQFMSGKTCKSFIEHLNQMAFAPQGENRVVTRPKSTIDIAGLEDEHLVDANEYDYEYSYLDRILRVFHICDIKNHYMYTVFRHDFSLAGTIDLVTDEVPNCNQYAFEFEHNKTADQAMKKLLNFANSRAFQKTFEERKIYLTAVNFHDNCGKINEWIRVTYEDATFADLQASHPKFTTMFAHIFKPVKKKVANVP